MTHDWIAEITAADCPEPRLWWLGGLTFAIKYRGIVFYVDPAWGDLAVSNAGLVMASGEKVFDGASLKSVMAASPHAKLVLPKSTSDAALALGVPLDRMRTTDNGLRIEYFKDGEYGRVYCVPGSSEGWTPLGGYPQLGYVLRFGGWNIWHSGPAAPYAELAERLRPYAIHVAIVAVDEGAFKESEASALAHDIGARWLIPMHLPRIAVPDSGYSRFVSHLLGHCPEQRFKIFEVGEGWTVPAVE